jgi:hypothetical protein
MEHGSGTFDIPMSTMRCALPIIFENSRHYGVSMNMVIYLLLDMKHEVEQVGNHLDEERTRRYETMYEHILRHGFVYQTFFP